MKLNHISNYLGSVTIHFTETACLAKIQALHGKHGITVESRVMRIPRGSIQKQLGTLAITVGENENALSESWGETCVSRITGDHDEPLWENINAHANAA